MSKFSLGVPTRSRSFAMFFRFILSLTLMERNAARLRFCGEKLCGVTSCQPWNFRRPNEKTFSGECGFEYFQHIIQDSCWRRLWKTVFNCELFFWWKKFHFCAFSSFDSFSCSKRLATDSLSRHTTNLRSRLNCRICFIRFNELHNRSQFVWKLQFPLYDYLRASTIIHSRHLLSRHVDIHRRAVFAPVVKALKQATNGITEIKKTYESFISQRRRRRRDADESF